jgi:hypothetical protein
VTRTTFLASESTASLPHDLGGTYFPSLRRWTRVFFSSLRCFFFAIRLRRFLMTEPTKTSSDQTCPGPRTCRDDPHSLTARG